MAMFKELDSAVLMRDLPEHGLIKGDVGAVVMVYGGGAAFEVEFVDSDGGTVALVELKPGDLSPLPAKYIRHVRALANA